MADKYKRNIATNRQLNFTLSPVDTHNQKEMPYELSSYSIDGTWNQHQSIMLDLLLDLILKKLYSAYNNFPKSWRSQKVLSMRTKFETAYSPVDAETVSNLTRDPLESFKVKRGYDIKGNAVDVYEHNVKNSGQVSFEQYFQQFLENSREYKSFLQEMDDNSKGFNKDFLLQAPVSELFTSYPILSNYYRRTWWEHIEKINNTKFKFNLKVKTIAVKPTFDDKGILTGSGQLTDIFYQMQNFEEIFIAKREGDNIFLNFKSPLGKLIIINTILLDTDWISEEVFSLPKNAYFIYKRFILNRVSGKNKPKELQLWFDDIKTFLDLKWDNNRGIHQIVEKALTALEEKGLIAGYSSNKNYVKQRQYCLRF